MQLIDPQHPFYRPLWIRLLIVGFTTAWAIFEFMNGDAFWGTIVGGVAAYSTYMLLLTFKPAPPEDAASSVRENDTTDR